MTMVLKTRAFSPSLHPCLFTLLLVLLDLPSICLSAPPVAGTGGYAIRAIDAPDNPIWADNEIPNFYQENDEGAYTFEILYSNPSGQGHIVDLLNVRGSNSQYFSAFHFQSDGDLAVFVDGHGTESLDSLNSTSPTGTASHLAAVHRRVTSDSSEVDWYFNGDFVETSSIDSWAGANPNVTMAVRLFGEQYQGEDIVVDNFRIWRGERSQDEIREMRFMEVEGADVELRFEAGVQSAITNHGVDGEGLGNFYIDDVNDYESVQLEVSPGYGMDTPTGVSVPSDVRSPFAIELIGDDVDGTPLVFEITSVPEEVEFESTEISDGFQAKLTATGDLAEATTLVFEYHVKSGGETSLKTRAYLELTPFTNPPFVIGLNAPTVAVALGGTALLAVMGLFLRRRKSSGSQSEFYATPKTSASSTYNSKNSSNYASAYSSNNTSSGSATLSSTSEPVPGSRRRAAAGGGAGKSRGQTVDEAIERLLTEFTVPQLNSYVATLIHQGKLKIALALALRVETHAVGHSAKEYTRAVENLGAIMNELGEEEAVGVVRTARRATMAATGNVKESALNHPAIHRVRKKAEETYKAPRKVIIRKRKVSPSKGKRRKRSGSLQKGSKRTGRRTSPMKSPAAEIDPWDVDTVRVSLNASSALKTVPISNWASGPSSDMISTTSSMAPNLS